MIRTGRIILVCILVSLSLAVDGVSAETGEWQRLFFNSNQAYEQGRYREAVEGYSKLIQSGHETGQLYYNLGNAYYRLRQLGRAILNYERARVFIPRDADLNFNLQQARGQVQDTGPAGTDLVRSTFFWLGDLSPGECLWGFVLLNILFWGVLLLRLFLRMDWTFYASLLLLIFWAVSGLSFGLKWYQVHRDDRAVVIKQETNVLAGPDRGDTPLFKLHEGVVLHLERREEGWWLVRVSEEKRGWLKSTDIEPVKEPS